MTTQQNGHWDWQQSNVCTWKHKSDVFTALVYESDSNEWNAWCYLHGDDAVQIGNDYPTRRMAMEACARHAGAHGVRHSFTLTNQGE